MAPNQTVLKTYFSERKPQSDSRVTRSLKFAGNDHLDDDKEKSHNIQSPKTPRKTRNKNAEFKSNNKLTPSKTLRSQKTTDSNSEDTGKTKHDEDTTPFVLDENNIDELFSSPEATPTKRRSKACKEPCSPPKIKCAESTNTQTSSSNTAATPSTLIKKLSLTSPVAEDKRQTSLPPKSLFPDLEDLLGKARTALHTHAQTSLPGREEELGKLNDFIQSHLTDNKSGSLYISGPPGTGKTACLTNVLGQPQLKQQFKVVNINCTSIESPKAIYSKIADQLNIQVKTKSGKAYLEGIERHFMSNHKMILMVLDEMDQLDTRSRSVLYTIFEWPLNYPSGIILIGIANALDLTDRLLPRLKAKLQLSPQLLHFAPYNRQQLKDILTKRLEEADASNVFNQAALQLLANKLSAVNGDARRALDSARRAVENKSQQLFDAKMNADALISPAEVNDQLSSDALRKSPRKVAPTQERGRREMMERMKSPLKSTSNTFKSPIKSPLKCTVNAVGRSPLKSPLKSTLRSPLKSPRKSPFKSPHNLNSPIKENCSPHKPKSAKKSLLFNEEETLSKSVHVTATPVVKEPCIDVTSIMNVVNDVYGTSQSFGRVADGGEELPLHQKLAVCSLLLILREGKSKDVTVGKLHDVYRRVCTKRHFDPLDSSAFLSLLGLIESRGILLLPGRGKRSRQTKVCMQWIEDEVVSALRDRDLLASIIRDRSCLS
ncbi:Cell division control protein 6-like protein [Frankliniella fusca]|uniref:Cell division control protein 6-like protein n=1 Tax=Frankliniella fusca TaxID=407009 RepID=A0AAE1HTN0_9NEOP|nr:Cell division control protein 6-like protein [Frankliniella fusca]